MSTAPSDFDGCVSALSPDSVQSNLSFDVRSRLYGLHKQATLGDVNETVPPFHDVLQRDLWEAWAQYRGTPCEDAKRAYVSLCQEVLSSGSAPAAADSSSGAPAGGDGGSSAAPTPIQTPPRQHQPPPGGAAATPSAATPGKPNNNNNTDGNGGSGSVSSPRPDPASDDGSDTAEPIPIPSKKGVLVKQRDVMKGWRERYFVLDGNMLFYYKQQNDTYPRGAVYLAPGCTITPLTNKPPKSLRGRFFPFIVRHRSTSQTYRLAASTQQECDDWIALLNAAVQYGVLSQSGELNRSATNGGSRSSTPLRRRRGDSSNVPSSPIPTMAPLSTPSKDTKTPVATKAAAPNAGAGAGSGAGGGGGAAAATVPAAVPVAAAPVLKDEPCVPDLSGPAADTVDRCMADMTRAMKDMSQWKNTGTKSGIRCYVGTGKTPSARGDGHLAYPPRAVLDMLLDPNQRGEYDAQFDSGHTVRKLNPQTDLVYLKFKPVFPTSARDFCNLSHWRVDTDGSIWLVAANHPDSACPPISGVVRANLVLGGWKIRPSGPDGQQCDVTYLMRTDPGGSIPTFVVKSVTAQQAMLISTLSKALDRKYPSGAPKMDPVVNVGVKQVPVETATAAAAPVPTTAPAAAAAPAVAAPVPTTTTTTTVAKEEPTGWVNPQPVPSPFTGTVMGAMKTFRRAFKDMSMWRATTTKEGVKCYAGTGSYPSARGDGVIPFPISAIKDVLPAEHRHEYDENFDSGRTVTELNPHTSLMYVLYETPSVFISQRDFLSVSYWEVDRDGTMFIVATSVEDSRVPPVNGHVRAQLRFGGWVLRPSPDGQSTNATYMVELDLCGSLPTSIVKRVTAVQGLLVATVRKYLFRLHPNGAPKAQTISNQGKPETKTVQVQSTSTAAAPTPGAVPVGGATVPAVPVAATSGGAGAGAAAVAAPSSVASSVPGPQVSDKVKNMIQAPRKLPPPHSFPFSSLLVLAIIPIAYYVAFMNPIGGLEASGPTWVMAAAVVFCIRYLVKAYVGPASMSTRRKLMIATWDAPSSGVILGALDIDCTNLMAYIAAKRKETGTKVTVTHCAIRAVAVAVSKLPTLNGHIVMGEYIPSPTVDIGCLVALEREENGRKTTDLGNVKIRDADRKPVETIGEEVAASAKRMRQGKDKEFEKTKPTLNALPTWAIRAMLKVVRFLGSELGIPIPALGVTPYPFGTVMLTSVGGMGLDTGYAPHTPFANVGTMVTVGAVRDKVVAVGGQPVVRPILTITAAIDHRYLDGSQGAKLASTLRGLLEAPELLDGVYQ